MPTLLMIRPQPLSPEEGLRLPSLCNPVRNGHPVVARADFSLSMGDIVQLAVRMSKAVPDADVVFHDLKPPPTGEVVDKTEYASIPLGIDVLFGLFAHLNHHYKLFYYSYFHQV